MIPAEIIELMHGEIDGANSASDSECLHAYLAAHPDVRVQFQELRDAVGIFSQVDHLEPPEGLRQKIVDALDALGTSRQAPRLADRASLTGNRGRAFWSNLRTQPGYRYAFACGFVIGLLLTVSAWQLIAPGPLYAPDDLRATIIHREAIDRGAGSEIGINNVPGVTGLVRVDKTLLRLELISERPVQIHLLVDDEFVLESYQATGSGLEGFSIDDRRITLTHQGSGAHDVVLHHPHERMPAISIQIHDDGSVIWEQEIRRERN